MKDFFFSRPSTETVRGLARRQNFFGIFFFPLAHAQAQRLSVVWREGNFFFFFYTRSRIWESKPTRTLSDHENMGNKRPQKNKNPNPNLRRRLGGVADGEACASSGGGCWWRKQWWGAVICKRAS